MEYVNGRVTLYVNLHDSAFNKRIIAFSVLNEVHIEIKDFLNDAFHIYKSELVRILEEHKHLIKTSTIFVAEFEKPILTTTENLQSRSAENENEHVNISENESERTVKQTLYFATPNKTVHLGTDLDKHYKENVFDEVLKSVENSVFYGSGFTLSRIIKLEVQVCSFEPIKGSSFMETSRKLHKKKAIVNVKNEHDDMCFQWAILSALYPVAKNPQRIQNYTKYRSVLNFDGIKFPVQLQQIDKFMELNSTISINVYYFDDDDDKVYPLRVCSDIRKNHIHLLLMCDETRVTSYDQTIADKITSMLSESTKLHYCWIKNLSRLISKQLSKHGHKNYICDRCLNFFEKTEKLTSHLIHCTSAYQVEMSSEVDKWLMFKNYEHQLKAPFVIYADSEAYLKQLNDDERKRVFSDKCSSNAYQEHCIYSIGYYFKCEFDDSQSYYASSGNTTDCIKWFVRELETIAQYAANILSMNQPMIELTPEEERSCSDPNAKCFICGRNFDTNEVRAHDHCHFSGKFRGIAHVKCNLNYQNTRCIPVIMHNLSGYDSHLFIKELATGIQGDITIIPINSEQYISFTKTVWNSTFGLNNREKIRLKFIDSFRFMSESLSKLASLIPSDKKRILHSVCQKDYSSEQISMLERKGVFPYDYVNSIERLSEMSLPAKEHFYSLLNEEEISSEEYEFACDIWKKFHLKTLGEYSDLYLKTDVLLLADVFENFRSLCHSIYKLDPAHFYTAPGYSMEAMLKYTGVNIELLTDVDMLIFIERGIRGGISQCSKRHVKANNKYMKDAYNPDVKSNYLMYLDGELITYIFIHYFIILMCISSLFYFDI